MNDQTQLLIVAAVFLAIAILIVPLTKRLGLGAMLGYLVSGMFCGPILSYFGVTEQTTGLVAEIGVVAILFLVGLEVNPARVFKAPLSKWGMGVLQQLLSTAAIMSVAMLLGVPFSAAIVIGLIVSSSSSAMVRQAFKQRGLERTSGAKSADIILSIQDLSVVILLAIIPLFAIPELIATGEQSVRLAQSLVSGLAGSLYAVVVLSAVVMVLLAGYFIVPTLFNWIAKAHLREMLTATAILVILSVSALMYALGLSLALGVFLAGLVLAGSDFRYELRMDIRPFEGIFLGVFFLGVGANLDWEYILANLSKIVAVTLIIVVLKFIVLVLLTSVFKVHNKERWLVTLSLAQAGEFGIVLTAFAVQSFALTTELGSLLIPTITFSMFLTPLLILLYDLVIRRGQLDECAEAGCPDKVIVAGIGRVGQVLTRYINQQDVTYCVIDQNAELVERVSSFGVHAVYGDASRRSLLKKVGVDRASVFVIAIDDVEKSVQLARLLRAEYRGLPIVARAFDRGHMYRLRHAGVEHVVLESFEGAFDIGKQVCRILGVKGNEKDLDQFRSSESDSRDWGYQKWLSQNRQDGFSVKPEELYSRSQKKSDD